MSRTCASATGAAFLGSRLLSITSDELWPYQREIADCLSDRAIERVTLVKGARVGFTSLLTAAIGYWCARDPAPKSRRHRTHCSCGPIGDTSKDEPPASVATIRSDTLRVATSTVPDSSINRRDRQVRIGPPYFHQMPRCRRCSRCRGSSAAMRAAARELDARWLRHRVRLRILRLRTPAGQVPCACDESPSGS